MSAGGAGARLLVVCDDLLFWSRIEDAARRAGTDVRRATGPEDAREALAAGTVRRVVADLAATSLDPLAVAAEWSARTPRPELVAFGSHVDAEGLARARRAGFDRVLARSALVRELAALVQW